ncbi:MAG: MFS transporter [Bifidobacteriaceae bacterium]|nr:MFS transporter [Bifidobacteriaceae bacterium]
MKHLSTAKLLLIAVGTAGPGLMVSSLGLYALRFFAPTEEVGLPLLMPIGWIGIIQGVALGFDFLIDPVIASWGDNSKNPKGRRLPLMRVALLPAVIFAVLVFFAPVPRVSWINGLWVLVMLLAYSFTRSLYDINLQALIPEVVADSHRRLRLFAIRTVIGLTGTIGLALVPGVVEGMRDGGAEAIDAWRICLTVCPVVALVLMAPVALFLRETDYVPANSPEQARTPLVAGLREVLAVKPFRALICGAVLLSFAASVTTSALQFYVDVLFGMKGGMSSVVLVVMIVSSLLFYPVVLPLSKRVGKKPLMLAAVAVCAVAYMVIYFYKPLGQLLGAGPAGSYWAGIAGEGVTIGYVNLLLILALILGFPICAINLLVNSAFTDITQYHTIRTGHRRAGMFAAAQALILAIPSTLVPAVVGLMIYIGSTDELPTVVGVRSTALVAGAVCIPSFIILLLYREREVMDLIRAQAEPDGPPDGPDPGQDALDPGGALPV